MAKALSLRKDRNKGTQRTRKLYTGELQGMLRKWEGTLRDAFLGEWTEGAEPCKVKALSTVLNGEREETYPQGNAPRAYPPEVSTLFPLALESPKRANRV
jgi:hypothetical protein